MLDSILRRKERIIKTLPAVQNPEARRILAGVFDAKLPSPPPPAEPEE